MFAEIADKGTGGVLGEISQLISWGSLGGFSEEILEELMELPLEEFLAEFLVQLLSKIVETSEEKSAETKKKLWRSSSVN